MAISKLEYIWLDGSEDMQGLRSKTKLIPDFSGELGDLPDWSFDGSSTQQAEGRNSDCILRPVALFTDPQRKNGYLVMTEVLNADGTPTRPMAAPRSTTTTRTSGLGSSRSTSCTTTRPTSRSGSPPADRSPGPRDRTTAALVPTRLSVARWSRSTSTS